MIKEPIVKGIHFVITCCKCEGTCVSLAYSKSCSEFMLTCNGCGQHIRVPTEYGSEDVRKAGPKHEPMYFY